MPDFENRKDEITKQLVEAAETAGFLTLVDHGISIKDIESQFAMSKAFFDLPKDVKGRIPHDYRTNNGWEYYVGACPTPPPPPPKIPWPSFTQLVKVWGSRTT